MQGGGNNFFVKSQVKTQIKPYLVLTRHGQSLWNQKNLFTGWRDVGLTAQGRREAQNTGAFLKRRRICFNRAFASILKRSILTLWNILEEMDMVHIPVVKSWRLNERHYGALQGMNKQKAEKIYGAAQIMQWRRGFESAPPPLKTAVKQTAGAAGALRTESLKDVQKRLLPFWQKEIFPYLQKGESILVSAHGNSLRALIKHLEGVSDADIFHRNIQTGEPLIYLYEKGLFRRLKP